MRIVFASDTHLSAERPRQNAEFAALLTQVAALNYAPVLTFHPGSQCHDPQVYVRHIEAAGL